LFVLAGLAEIGGGYLVWLWLREGYPFYWGILGGVILFLYGIIATFQTFSSFGRVYAAYGGVFILLSVLWGWVIDRKNMIGSVRQSVSLVLLSFYLLRANK
jgi:small multidrug resistance family-3 protein